MNERSPKLNIRSSCNIIKRLLVYLYKFSPLLFMLNTILALLLGITSAMSIYATQLLINGITLNYRDTNSFIKVLISYIGISFFIRLFTSVSNYISNKHQIFVNHHINRDVLYKCIGLGVKDFEDAEIYNVIGKAKSEGQFRIYNVYRDFISMISQIISIISVSTLILTTTSYLYMLVFIVPIISAFISVKLGQKNYKVRTERINEIRKMSYIDYLATNNIAFKEIKVYDIGNYIFEIYKKLSNGIKKQDLNLSKIGTYWTIVLSILDEIINFIIILKVFSMTIHGKMMIGTTVAYINSLSKIQGNINNFLNSISQIYNDTLFVEQFFFLKDLEFEDMNNKGIIIDEIKEIRIENLYYKYENTDNYILKDVSITMKKEDLIGIIGENGSGKTTFIKLICGFYDNYEGKIFINNIELRHINKSSIREKMGVVFQDFNKYEFTLRENIGFGNLTKIEDDSAISRVLNEVGIKDKVEGFERYIDSQMGKWFNGEELSMGQWQRIALARAFIRDSDILILDEPTSSLDPISERDVFTLLKSKSKSTITIIITHRLENLEYMNAKILVFEDGRIVEQGYHNDLIEYSEKYKRMILNSA